MTDKRFERVYGDVEVVCIDHQKYGEDKFIDYLDYDKFVELLNELNEENQRLKNQNARLHDKNKRLHKDWDKLWDLVRDKGFTDEEIIKELD